MSSSPCVRRGAAVRRRVISAFCVLSLGFHWGCYTYLPVQSTPPAPRERVGVVLTDLGRVQLGDRLGPAVEQVNGVLVTHDSTGVVLEVLGIRDLRGGSALWSGERVELPASAILGYRPRVLSKSRSVLLAGGLAATLAALTLGLSFDLFGIESDPSDVANPTDPSAPISTRIPGLVPVP